MRFVAVSVLVVAVTASGCAGYGDDRPFVACAAADDDALGSDDDDASGDEQVTSITMGGARLADDGVDPPASFTSCMADADGDAVTIALVDDDGRHAFIGAVVDGLRVDVPDDAPLRVEASLKIGTWVQSRSITLTVAGAPVLALASPAESGIVSSNIGGLLVEVGGPTTLPTPGGCGGTLTGLAVDFTGATTVSLGNGDQGVVDVLDDHVAVQNVGTYAFDPTGVRCTDAWGGTKTSWIAARAP